MLTFANSDSSHRAGRRGFLPRWVALLVAFAMSVVGLTSVAAPASAAVFGISNNPTYIAGSSVAAVGSTFTPTFSFGTGSETVTSSTTSVCTVSGIVVSFIAAGTCSLSFADGPPPALTGTKTIQVGTVQVTDRPDGTVNAIAQDANGNTYLGGAFTSVRTETGSGGAMGVYAGVSPYGGAVDHSMPAVAGGDVRASAVDGNGGWYIGGSFTSVGGVTRNGLAHILPNGSVDAWNPNPNGTVYAMLISGTSMYVGGSFTTFGGANGTTRNRLAAFDLSASPLSNTPTSFDPNLNGTVNALAASTSSGVTKLIAGGAFTTVAGSTTRNRAAAWLASDGTLDSLLNPDLDGEVYALYAGGSSVYLGGAFTHVYSTGANTARNYVVKFDAFANANVQLQSYNPNVNGAVRAIVASGSNMFLGGDFTKAGSTTYNHLLRTDNSSGTPATTTGSTRWYPNVNGNVYALAVQGSVLYFGGSFSSTSTGVTRSNLAAISTANNTVVANGWLAPANGTVYSLATTATQVYAGGAFSTLGSTARNNLASLDSNGVLTSFDPNVTVSQGGVKALAVIGTKVYAGGAISAVNGGGASRGNLAAWDMSSATPNTPISWNPNANAVVNAMVASGNTLYVGGDFTTLAGSTGRNRLAAFDTSSATPDTPTSWDPNANGAVNALAVSGSTVYAGGAFTTIGSSTRNRLAVIGTDGTLASWDPNAGDAVNALAVSGSTVYAGGAFTTIGSSTRNRLAAIGTDGTLASWDPNAGDAVNALAVSGSTVYAGGAFTTIGSSTRNRLAAIGSDGTLSSWNPNADAAVNALFASGSSVYAGGAFTTVATTPGSRYLAKLKSAAVTVTAASPSVDSNTVPSISYTSSPSSVAGDWTTQPTCGVYASSDTGFATALTGTRSAGTYVTHCSGGVGFDSITYVDGSLTVTQYRTPVAVTASSPSSILSSEAVPSIGYTTSPSTVAGDWTAEPTCAVYASTDTAYATPLSGTQPAGTYVTHCSGGTSDSYNPTSYVNGSLTVTLGSSYTVTNCSDSGVGSLRYALAGVAAGATISFDVSCSTIYPLTTLYLTKDVTINGPTSAGLVIDGSSEAALGTYDPGNGPWAYKQNPLFVNGGVTATIRNLTFQNGTSLHGGAIYVQGSTSSSAYTNLRVENSTFKNNQAWLGGAIESADPSTDSSAYYGPDQVHLYANLTVVNSTFANNSTIATGDGGAIDNGEYGGYGTVRILGSTFTGNRSDFGVLDNCDDLVYVKSTCTAAMYVSGSVFANAGARIQSSAATEEFNSDPTYGTVKPIDLGYNISDDNTLGFTESTSVSSSATINASLAALASNGGPTQTVLPSSSSPAVGAIPASTTVTLPASTGVTASSYQLCSRTDQRGVASGGNGRCTIGSVEVSAKTSVVVTAASPSSVNSATALPSVGYTTSPSTVAGDWTVEPTCSVYSTTDTGYTNPLTGVHSAGTYVTHCSAGTSTSYNPTSYVNGSLTVTSASTDVAVTAASPSSVNSATALPSVGYTTSPSTVAGDWTVEPTCAVYSNSDTGYTNPLTGVHSAGTYVTHCSGGTSTSYNPTSYVNGSLTVTSASTDVAVTAATSSITYGASIPSVGYTTAPSTIAGDWTAEPSCAVYSTADTTFASPLSGQHSAGTYVTHCSGGTSSSYTPTSYVDGVLTIDMAASSTVITCPTAHVTYTGSAQTPCSAVVTGAGGLSTTASVTYASNTDAGTATADASYAGDANHNSSSAAQSSFVIDQASSTTTVTCSPKTTTYSGSAQTLCSAVVTGAGGLDLTDLTPSYSSNTAAGTSTATYSFVGDANHASSQGSDTFSIDPATVVVTADSPSLTYGDSIPSITYSTSPTTVAGDWTTEPSCSVFSTSDTTFASPLSGVHSAGTYVTHCSNGSSSNYTTTVVVDGSLTIYKAASTTVITCPASITYSGSYQEPCTAAVTGVGDLSTTATVTYANNRDAGTGLADSTYVGDANHMGSDATQSSFTIDKASTSTVITCPTSSETYDGGVHTPCSADVTGAGLATTASVIYTNNTNAGIATADASYDGDSNHTSSTAVQSGFTIDQAPSTTTVSCPASSVTYNGSEQTPCTASVSGAGLSQSADVVYSPNTDAGLVSASASFIGDANHYGSSDQSGFTIDQAVSTTTVFCSLSSVTYNGSAQTPCSAQVTGAGGLSQSVDVVYSPNTDAGSVSVSASFIGDANHYGSSDASGFAIDQATSTTTVSCSPSSVTYNGSAQTPCTAQVSGDGGLSQSLDVMYSPNTDAGSVSASASFQGDANHSPSSDQSGFTIDQATTTTTVSCSSSSVTYDGSAQTPCSAQVSGDGGLSQSLDVMYSPNTDAGSVSVSASFQGDANHSPSSDQSGFTIDQATSTTTVSCSVSSVTYDGNAQTPCSASVSGAGGLSQGVDVQYSPNTDAGSVSASASFQGDTNHYGSSDQSGFTIDQATSTTTVSCSVSSVTYNGSAQTPCSASVSGAGGLSQSVDVMYSPNTDAGSVSASASFQGDTNHYGSSDQSGFTIDQAGSSVTVNCPSNVTYDGSAQAPCSADVSGDGGLSQSLDVNYSPNTDAGSVSADASFPGDTNHYGSSNSSGFTIDQATSTTTVSCSVSSVTYDGNAQTPCSATVTGAGGLSQSVDVVYGNNVDAGSVSADASFGGDANHSPSSDQSGFTITQAPSSVTVNCPSNVTYDGSAQQPCSAEVSGPGGLSQGVGVSYSSNTDAGSVSADASYGGDANHQGSSGSSGFMIDPAASSVSVNCPSNVTYNGSAQEPCSADVSGVGGLSQSLSVNYGSNTDAGSATADATFGGDQNHIGSSGSSGFTIDQASSSTTVTCSPKSTTYSGLAQALCSASVTGAGGLNLTNLTPDYFVNVNVGTATASYTFAGDSNHTGSDGSDTFAIDPSAVVVTPSSPTITYGASIPTITYTTSPVTTASDWTTEPVCAVYATADTTFSTPLTGVVGAGSYVTHCSNGSSANYTTSSSVAGTLTVDKAASTTSITCPTAHETYTGSALTPCTATVTRVAAADTTTAVTYGANTNAGTATTDATYDGDANHNSSTATQSSFVIDKASSTTVLTCPTVHVTFDGTAQTPCSAVVTGAGGFSKTPTFVIYADNTDAGTATLDTADVGDANHTGSSASSSFVIDRAASSTVITCPTAHATFDGSALTPCSAAVTGAGGLSTTETVVYGSNTNAGTATADATYAGDGNHTTSTATQSSFVIDKASSSTLITCPTSHSTYTGSAQTLCSAAVTGAGGLSTAQIVVYGSNTNAGTATADATYAGDSNHNGSTAAQSSFVIDKAASSTVITCSPTSVTYTGSAQTPCGSTAVVTGAGGLSTTVAVTYGANTNTGTGTADASYVGDANHTGSLATQQSFTITKAASTTTITCAPSYVYTGSPIENCTAAVTGAGGLSTSVTPSYSTDHTNVGNVTVNASYGGDANHNGSSATQVSFTITKAASATLISCPASVTYNATAQTPCSAAVTGAGGLSTTATVTYASNTNAGSATANASYAGDLNHFGSTATQVSFVINQNPVVVSAPIISTTYGTAVPAVGYSTSPTTVAGDWTTAPTCAVYAPLGVVALTGVQPAGTYETRCSGGVSANYAISSYVKGSLTITPATSTTTITCVAAAYTGSAVTPCTATVTGAGLTAITATPTYTNNINAGTNTATATYTWPGDANHTGSTGSLNFSIGQALPTVTITCTATSVVYTGLAQTPCGTTATVTGPGGLSTTVPLVYTSNVDVATSTSTTAPTATASYAGGGNYLTVSVFKTFAITKAASVTVAVASPTVAYSATLPTITATAPAGGFTTNPTCGVYATAAATTALTGAQNVGTYVTKCSGGVARNFTAITYTNGTLTITKAATVSVTASTPTAITYGAALPTVTSTTPGGGWTTAPTCGVYASATATAALTGVQNAGTAYVTKCSGGVALNYTAVTYVNGKLTINKAATTSVTASSGSISYGTALPTITATAPAGGWTTAPTCGVYANATSTTRLTGTQNVGSYVTKCSGGVAVNYTAVTYVNGTFTITKGNVYVTAQSTTGTRNGNIPTPTYTTNPTGVTFTTAPTCRVYASTDTTYATPLTGKFPAVSAVYVTRCTGAVSANYTPTYVNGTITVA